MRHATELDGQVMTVSELGQIGALSVAARYIVEQHTARIAELCRVLSAQIPSGVALDTQAEALLSPANMPNELAIKILHTALSESHPDLTHRDVSRMYERSGAMQTQRAMALIAGVQLANEAQPEPDEAATVADPSLPPPGVDPLLWQARTGEHDNAIGEQLKAAVMANGGEPLRLDQALAYQPEPDEVTEPEPTETDKADAS